MVMAHPEGSIGWYVEGEQPKWRDASLDQIRAFESGDWNQVPVLDDGMGDYQPDVPSSTFWVVPETSPNVDFDVHQGRVGNWWEPVATVIPSGETDLAGETVVERSWMEYEAPGVITRAIENQDWGSSLPIFEGPATAVPEIPTFGGAYEAPGYETPLGFDWQTVINPPSIPWEFGVVAGDEPGKGPGSDQQTVTNPPVVPWDVQVEDGARTPQEPWFNWTPPWEGWTPPDIPMKEIFGKAAVVVTPAASLGVDAATDPKGFMDDFGLGLGQTIAGIGGLLILFMMIKD